MDEKKFEDLKMRISSNCDVAASCYHDYSKPSDGYNITRHELGFNIYLRIYSFVENLRDFYLISPEQYQELKVLYKDVYDLYLG